MACFVCSKPEIASVRNTFTRFQLVFVETNFLIQGEVIPQPGGVETLKLRFANLKYMIHVCPICLHVLGFNAAVTARVISWRSVTHTHVFPGFLTPALTQLSFQSHRLLFSHVSAEVRGENSPKRVCLNRVSNLNHQVMSPTRSPLSHPGGLVYVQSFNTLEAKL